MSIANNNIGLFGYRKRIDPSCSDDCSCARQGQLVQLV